MAERLTQHAKWNYPRMILRCKEHPRHLTVVLSGSWILRDSRDNLIGKADTGLLLQRVRNPVWSPHTPQRLHMEMVALERWEDKDEKLDSMWLVR